MKQLQRKFRAHLGSNRSRVDLLSRCMELCAPSLQAHIHIVNAGRGLDLRSLTTYESDQMKRFLHDAGNHRLVKQMQTPSFHAYLRANMQKFSLLLRESTTAMLNVHKALVDSAVRRPLLLETVFKKRRQFSLLFNSQMRLEINIPKVSVADARSFIQGGADPISSFLEAVAQKEGDLVSNYQQRRNRTAKEAAAAFAEGPRASDKLANNTMLFLAAVTAEEIALLVLMTAERAHQIIHKTARPQGEAVSPSGNRRMSSLPGTVPASLASFAASLEAPPQEPKLPSQSQGHARRPTVSTQRRPSLSSSQHSSSNLSSGGVQEHGSVHEELSRGPHKAHAAQLSRESADRTSHGAHRSRSKR